MLAPSPSPRKAVMRCWTRTCATPRIASRGATFMSRLAPLLFLALPLWPGGCATVLHEQALVTEEFMVASADPGIELYVRNKRPASESRFPGERIVLLGWSGGTTIMATYATRNPDRVNKLLLYAPQWIRTTPSLIATSGPLGAYRVVQEDAAKARWLTGVPETKKAELIPPGWFDAWAAATFSSDPWGVKQSPKKLRAPNGTQQDTREYWSAGKAYYEPETIRVPTLLLVGEWDQDTPPYMAQALFPKLVNAPYKQLVP